MAWASLTCVLRQWHQIGWSTIKLSHVFHQLDHAALIHDVRHHEIEWTFNPPHASQHGGLWECTIRTVRHVRMAVMTPDTCLTDEILRVYGYRNTVESFFTRIALRMIS